jgi:nucleotide-binding universal stress UspA family protein
MFSKILVPLDGTKEAESAIAPAAELARRFESTVVLVEVTPGYGAMVGATAAESFGASGSVNALAEAEIAKEAVASAYLDLVRTNYGTPLWQTVVAEGSSADAIVQNVADSGADLVVMATHARSGFKRLFLGSVAEDVIRHVGIPVLLVHSNVTDDSDDDDSEDSEEAG